MIGHHFKLAKKALLKNKYYTFINVFGLVFGMLSVLIIAKYVGGSLLFDNFHQNKDRIYSITQEESINGDAKKTSVSTYWGVAELVDQYPEVINKTRYGYHVESLVLAEGYNGDKISFLENRIFCVDSAFLKIFTFPFIKGNRSTALSNVKSMVLTRSAAQRYFKNSDPIGKSLTVRASWGLETVYEVTGVLENVPKRSQFRFDFLVTQLPLGPEEFWHVPDFSTYLLMQDDHHTQELAKKLTSRLSQVPQLRSANKEVVVALDSFADVQLSTTEYLLITIGIFITLISWMNYINQVIAQSYLRIKEIGILRVIGATRSNLKAQFVVESTLICSISLVLIVGIYLCIEPALQSLTNGHLLPLVNDPTPINLLFVGIFIIGIASAGAIPTVILITQNFGASLRNFYASRIGGIGLRKVLVVSQFSISTILIISVFVISSQFDYMNHKDKGIDMNNVVIIQAPMVKDTTWNAKRKALQLFKDKCAMLPFVKQLTSSTTVPSEEYRQETYLSLNGSMSKSVIHQNGVDEHFFDLYNVKFIAGNNFVADAKWKNNASIILNESAARALGIVELERAINAKITDHESNQVYDLIGIVKDYHQTSLKYEIRPIAFKFNIMRGHLSLKIDMAELSNTHFEETLTSIKEIWEQTYPDAYFDHYFLEEKFALQDMEDQYFGKMFRCFTALSIIISCLGLFGLSLLISTKRQKEIGVRKVFGASSADILSSFLKSYLQSLCIAMFVGIPIAYQLMTLWLSNYAYRVDFTFEVVTIALFTLTGIFLLTIAYHTIKSSISNPVAILRD